MRCAHTLSYPQSYSSHQYNSEAPTTSNLQIQSNLDILSSSLYCLTAVLPASVGYQGEYLSFSTTDAHHSIQTDSDKHAIHLMMQLSRFMIYHQQIFNTTLSHLGLNISLSDDGDTSSLQERPNLDKRAWNLYLAAAGEIIEIIRNCSPKHVPNVNPFLASTIWLCTAAYIVARNLDPPLIERRVAESSLDLLRINLNAYVSFWGVSATFQKKLGALEAKLHGLKSHNTSGPPEPSQRPEEQPRPVETVSPYVSGNWDIPLGAMDPCNNNVVGQRGGWNLGVWGTSGPSPNIFPAAPEANMPADMDSDLWGWRIDELLNYGAFE